MRFLVDRCAGRRLAHWLREQGHDVREAAEVSPDPGDQALLAWAVREERVAHGANPVVLSTKDAAKPLADGLSLGQ